MNDKKLLLLSNSTNFEEPYLQWPRKFIEQFLGEIKNNVLFIPYAGITISWDEYFEVVSESLKQIDCHASRIDKGDPVSLLKNAAAIIIGGGNSFHLLANLQKSGIMDLIREKVNSGTPYIGWSAGSNVACPTIKTTNDMPVIEPENFNALNLVRFQINPHYTEKTIAGHGGESRSQRIEEFLEVNNEKSVLGLPEGSLLKIEGDRMEFQGSGTLKIFQKGMPVKEAHPGDRLDWLLKN